MNGKGSAPRRKQNQKAYTQGWDRLWGNDRKRKMWERMRKDGILSEEEFNRLSKSLSKPHSAKNR